MKTTTALIALVVTVALPVLAEQASDYYGKAPMSLDYPTQALPGKKAPSLDQFELPTEAPTKVKKATKRKQLAST